MKFLLIILLSFSIKKIYPTQANVKLTLQNFTKNGNDYLKLFYEMKRINSSAVPFNLDALLNIYTIEYISLTFHTAFRRKIVFAEKDSDRIVAEGKLNKSSGNELYRSILAFEFFKELKLLLNCKTNPHSKRYGKFLITDVTFANRNAFENVSKIFSTYQAMDALLCFGINDTNGSCDDDSICKNDHNDQNIVLIVIGLVAVPGIAVILATMYEQFELNRRRIKNIQPSLRSIHVRSINEL